MVTASSPPQSAASRASLSGRPSIRARAWRQSALARAVPAFWAAAAASCTVGLSAPTTGAGGAVVGGGGRVGATVVTTTTVVGAAVVGASVVGAAVVLPSADTWDEPLGPLSRSALRRLMAMAANMMASATRAATISRIVGPRAGAPRWRRSGSMASTGSGSSVRDQAGGGAAGPSRRAPGGGGGGGGGGGAGGGGGGGPGGGGGGG